MANRKKLTDQEVEQEILRLKASPLVAIGQAEERVRYRRRQYMYCLRQYEKKGAELAAAGITVESLLAEEKEMRHAQQSTSAT